MNCRDYVLRTLASVPIDRYVLVLGCDDGRYTAPLLKLGFPVHACSTDTQAVHATRTAIADLMEDPSEATECVQRCAPTLDAYPDSVFDWVVAPHLNTYADVSPDTAFDVVQRILKPAGWAVLGVQPPAVPVAANEEPVWPATRDAIIAQGQKHHLAEAARSDTNDTDRHLYHLFRRER